MDQQPQYSSSSLPSQKKKKILAIISHKKRIQDLDIFTTLSCSCTKGGRVLYGLDGKIETKFLWGLGVMSDNIVEMYILLQGLNIAKHLFVNNFILVGDAKNIILGTYPTNLKLNSIFKHMKNTLSSFISFHVSVSVCECVCMFVCVCVCRN